MITERLMSQGSFEIPFAQDAPYSLWETISKFGHMVIVSQWVDHRHFTDASLLAASRYTGVVLHKEVTNQRMTMFGAGLVWWLGDEEEKGDIIETEQTFSGSSLGSVVTALLPASLTIGTTYDTGTSYYGSHQWESPITAIRTAAYSTAGEFKVNADGTVDVGPNTDLYNLDTPDIVLTRRNYGSDPNYIGLPPEEMTTELNSRPYASIVYLVRSDGTLVDSHARTPAPTARDLNGNLVDRGLVIESDEADPIAAVTYTISALNDHSSIQDMNISTEWYEIDGGDFRIGDGVWAYDPPAFFNEANVINYRGDTLFPIKLRIIEATWPLRSGMGVYYRSPETTPEYTDLTQYVDFEAGVFSTAQLRPYDEQAKGGGET